MRMLPFFKPKKGFMVAGGGLETSSGGGGGGGGGKIDYTTEEQNTGLKWINNKPVYQKTVTLLSLSNSSNTLLENVDDVINISGFILREGGVYKDYVPYYADNVKFIVFRVNTNHQLIYERGSADDVKRGTLTVTIRYTKTTD